MGRGRPFAGHKIVPPKGARWAPKPNKVARCVGMKMAGFAVPSDILAKGAVATINAVRAQFKSVAGTCKTGNVKKNKSTG